MGLARLRKGDNVIIISGENAGKTGKILRLLVEDDKVVVEGVNLIKRHMRPTPKNPSGGILEREAPIHASKVMPVDPKSGKGTRVRVGKDDKGHKIRMSTKGEEIPAPKAS
jgi:large subunit ribosomal protein L24